MARGHSNANEVWIAGDVVLRINWRGVGRLAREAQIAACVPRQARCPEVLAVGDDGEIEWMLARRVAGIDLGRAWVTMTAAERERAIHERADALAALHATPCADIPDDILPPHTLPLADLLALIAELRSECMDPGSGAPPDAVATLDACAGFVTEHWPAFDDRDRGLVHGDPHPENFLWDGTQLGVSAKLPLLVTFRGASSGSFAPTPSC